MSQITTGQRAPVQDDLDNDPDALASRAWARAREAFYGLGQDFREIQIHGDGDGELGAIIRLLCNAAAKAGCAVPKEYRK